MLNFLSEVTLIFVKPLLSDEQKKARFRGRLTIGAVVN